MSDAFVGLLLNIVLCFNSHNKTVYYDKNKTILYNYSYYVTATCFVLSLDYIIYYII
jgi:hypothetical protein